MTHDKPGWCEPDDIEYGRELAAQAIEAEARAYEAQFGIDGSVGEVEGVLWMAAQLARGETTNNERQSVAMNISLESIDTTMELISNVHVPVALPDGQPAPDAATTMTRLSAAYREFYAARQEILAVAPNGQAKINDLVTGRHAPR